MAEDQLAFGVGIGVVLVLFLALQWVFRDIVRAEETSPNGDHAEVRVDGAPLSGGTRILVWDNGRPWIRPLACKAFESNTEQPIALNWNGAELVIQHAYEPSQVVLERSRCDEVTIIFEPTLKPYS